MKHLRVAAVLLACFGASCSTGQAGLAGGEGRLAGRVGPGSPEANGVIPALRLTFSDGKTTVKTTVDDGSYSVDLPAGTWQVHSDDGGVCATGLRVAAAGSQRSDLMWPTGFCADYSGPPAPPSPPTRR